MGRWQYTRGLHDLGNGAWAWLQPHGTWGWSNAGLIADSGETLLVDTLFDLPLTAEMLAGMRAAVPSAARIGTLVNTHANGDHTFGNQLVAGAEIIASTACAREMRERPPEELVALMNNWRALGPGGAFLHQTMGSKFAFNSDIVLTPPTRTFDGELTLTVGSKEVHLVEVGPAHTGGDTLIHVPGDRTVFTGDILFIAGHPVMWAGPVSNWIAACDRILGWDVETIVPGHGPITDKAGVRALKHYFEHVRDESRRRFDAGMTAEAAARDIDLRDFAGWLDAERIVANVAALYREFTRDATPPDVLGIFAAMGRYHDEHKPG